MYNQKEIYEHLEVLKYNWKVFQSNANCMLSNSPCFIVNKFECGGGVSLYSKVKVEQVRGWGWGWGQDHLQRVLGVGQVWGPVKGSPRQND